MPKENEDLNDDLTDDIFEEDDADRDELSEFIGSKLAEADKEADEDDAGMDQPPVEEGEDEDTTVSVEEGAKIAKKAEIEGNKPKDDEKTPEAKKPEANDSESDAGSKEKAATEDGKDDDTEGGEAADKDGGGDEDLSKADLDTLMKGVPKSSRAEITKRLNAAQEAYAPFENPYIQQQMKQHGSNPQEVTTRLVELASFASEKPDEYLAWAASEMAASPDKIGEVLGKAAALHGYKVVKDEPEDEDDDDIFADEETKRLKQENAELRRQVEGGQQREFGPDTPERQQRRTLANELTSFVNERGEDGNLKRPYFEQLQPQIQNLVAQHVQTTGKLVSVADLDGFYTQALDGMRNSLGIPAAQPTPPVPEQKQQDAAAVERSKRASTSVDGTGQGASRRPAQPASDDIGDIIRHAMSQGE